jgi:hypothetical protein
VRLQCLQHAAQRTGLHVDLGDVHVRRAHQAPLIGDPGSEPVALAASGKASRSATLWRHCVNSSSATVIPSSFRWFHPFPRIKVAEFQQSANCKLLPLAMQHVANQVIAERLI